MNSRYWGKLIKLLNYTNSVYNLNNNGSEIEKSALKTTYCGAVWGKGLKACWHLSTWVCASRCHVSR